MFFLKKMGQPRPIFVNFRSFQTQILQKTEDVSGIRTQIVWVEGKETDHLTPNTALWVVAPCPMTILNQLECFISA